MSAIFHDGAADRLKECVVEVRQGPGAGSGLTWAFDWAFDVVVTNAQAA